MAKIPKGKRAIIFGQTYINEVPDALVKYLPKGFIDKPVAESKPTKPKNDNK